ncbi:MAG: hypothetical protein HY026_08340 [Deltaproteobacteria bacterium]|nr:hypothetical protein [Deltaproteobacteria bacterium]
MEAQWANKNGSISISTLIWIFLIAVAVYLGIKFVPPYFNYYMFKVEVEAEAGTAYLHHDHDVIRHIMEKVKESELPIDDKDIIIERRENTIEISINYKIELNFFNSYYKTLYFNIDAIKPIKAKQ